MATVKNKVNKLTWNVPIVNKDGTPTDEFMRKWLQQGTANASVTDLSTAKNVSAVLDLISSARGSLLYRGALQWLGLAAGTVNQVLATGGVGADPFWSTTHYIPAGGTLGQSLTKSSGADYDVAWTTDASGGGAASIQDNGTTVYVALSDLDGQLVLDGSGDPVFVPEVFPVGALPAAGGYISGTLTNATVNKVKGVTDGSDAAAGDVGEFIEAIVTNASATAIAMTATPQTLTSISLTAGDWDIEGLAAFSPSGASNVTLTLGSFNTVTNVMGAVERWSIEGVTVTNRISNPLPRQRFSIASTTIVYLVVQANFATGSCTTYGYLNARRIR